MATKTDPSLRRSKAGIIERLRELAGATGRYLDFNFSL
jgi:hypothetical protein